MPRLHPRFAARILFACAPLLICGFLLTACSSEGEASYSGPPGFRRGTLDYALENGEVEADPEADRVTATPAAASLSADPEIREVGRIRADQQLEGWSARTRGKDGEDLPLRATRSKFGGKSKNKPLVAAVDGKGVLMLAIPNPPSPETYNRVVARVLMGQGDTISVALDALGEKRLESPPQACRANKRFVDFTFDVPRFADLGDPSSPLYLYIKAEDRRPEIQGLAFHYVPRDTYLPSPGDPEEMVMIAEEAYWATSLSSRRPLASEFPAANHRALAFAIGQPAKVHRQNEELEVIVRLTAEGLAQAEEHRFAIKSQGKWAPWRRYELDLSGVQDRAFRATFHLESDRETEALCALSRPEHQIGPLHRQPQTVLLVTSDTHRADHIGMANLGVDIATPFLDGLARRGVFFRDCYSSANVTVPSHAALMTGVTPRDHGVLDNGEYLGSAAPTLAERFADAGFVTLAAVSMGTLTQERSGMGQGFDRLFAPVRGTRDSSITIASLRAAMEDYEGLPLFVWLHSFDAHTPYEPPASFVAHYYPEDKDPNDPSLPALPEHIARRIEWSPGARDLNYILAQYKGEVSYMDDQLAQLITGSRFEDGILAITSDHGEHLGAHELYFTHAELYPGTLHVPLIMRWPGAPQRIVEEPVRQIDIGRTLLNLAGARDQEFPGFDLSADLEGGALRPRFAIHSKGWSASVNHAGHLLVMNLVTRGSKHSKRGVREKHTIQLHDLRRDPHCDRDIAQENPRVAGKMRRMLIEWLTAVSTDGWRDADVVASAEDLAELAALGYSTAAVERDGSWFDPECDCTNCIAFD